MLNLPCKGEWENEIQQREEVMERKQCWEHLPCARCQELETKTILIMSVLMGAGRRDGVGGKTSDSCGYQTCNPQLSPPPRIHNPV